MQSELLSGRRLRFDMEMDPRESIPGVIARGVREHVLVWTRPVLEAAGVKLTHIGHSQLASPAELERLAYVARCSDQALLANAGVRISPEGGGRAIDIRFGGHDVPLALIELNRRRIAPLSLRLRPHHRLDWMNLLLPYCPESLERLISTCPACDSRLGWHYAKGIGHCEYCEGEVPPSLEGGLPDHLAEEYRLFAKLSSSVGADVSEAMTALPPDLRDMAPKNLVRLALMTGGMVQPEPVVTTSRKAVLVVPKPTLACVIASGTAFLQSWPAGFQKWVAERRESTRHDPAAYRDLRNRLRRLTSRNDEEDELTGLVHEAFPKLGLHPVHSLPNQRRYYLYQQVQRKLGLEPRQMVRLRTHPEVRFTALPSPCFQKGQFDAEHIDALEPIFRESVQFNSCTGRLGLPLYAIEQACRPRLLERERDPVFEAVKSARSVTPASLAAFTMALKASRLRSRPPKHAVSLSVATKQIGGRRKPWASILLALLDRRIDFWIVGAHPTPQSIRVRPSDLSVFLQVVDQPERGVIHSAEVSQADAAEILNIRSDRLASIAESVRIPFFRTGRALHAPMPAVLAVAGETAWDTEISWHLGVRFHLVEDLLLSRRIPRRSTGWCRRRLIEEEILPPLPTLMEASGAAQPRAGLLEI